MGKEGKQFRLTKKLFMAFLLSAGLPILVAIAIYLAVISSLNRRVTDEILADRVQTATLLLEARKTAISERLQALSADSAVTVNAELGLAPAVASRLSDAVEADRLDDVTVWDADGRYFAGAANPESGLPAAIHPGLPARQAAETVAVRSIIGGGFYFAVTRRLSSGSGRPLGVISARLGCVSLCDAISSELAAPLVLIDSSGRVLAQAGLPGEITLLPGASPPKFPALAAFTFKADGSSGGEAISLRFVPVRRPGGTIAAWLGSAYSSAKLDDMRNRGALSLLLVMVAILAACASVSAHFSRTITRPVRALADTARKIAKGDYRLSASIDQNDEIGDLSRDIDTMAKTVLDQMRELESTRNYLDNVVDSLPSALVAVNRAGEVTQWNEAAGRLARMGRDEAMGKRIWRIFPFLKDGERALGEVLGSQEPLSLPRETVAGGNATDAPLRHIDVSLYPLVHDGEAGAVFRFDDVTELERKESQLRQAQKMEMLGNLTSGMAHDFNNILMGIMGTASLLSLRIEEGRGIEPAELKADIDSIVGISERAKELVKQLLSLARRQEVSFQRVDLSAIVDSVAKICRTSFDKSVSILPELPESPAIVLADPVLIEQVILNICVNAAHAMTIMRPIGQIHGGRLEIGLERLSADARFCSVHPFAAEGPYFAVRVSDTGVGIAPETMPKIFDPFFTTKTPGQGSGLGLSTAYGIVRQHGGFIDAYSTPGRGSVFRVYLPDRSDCPAEPGAAEPQVVYPGEGLVMVLDDEADVRKVASSMLSQCGYDPVAVETVSEAEKALTKLGERLRALVLDMSMPDMPGEEAFRVLKAKAPWLKVLIASGLRDEVRVQALLDKGARAFIQKPFTVYEFSKRLRETLSLP